MSDAGIRLSETVTLAGDLRGETVAVLGMKGKGKSNTAKVIVEQLLHSGEQVVVIDPTDAWWGLTRDADGGDSGLSVVALGGEHGAVDLEERHAEALLPVILERRQSVVLCTRMLSGAGQRRFVANLLEGLYNAKGGDKRPLWIVIDEADMFAPKQVRGDTARSKGAVDDISRRGRIDGFGLLAITQRPAALHNDVLSQADTVVCHGLGLQHDRTAIKEWIGQHDGDPQRERVFMGSLRELKRGEAWVWRPGADVFERTTIDLCRTWDSGKTPDGTVAAEPSRGGPGAGAGGSVDLDALRALLAPPKPPEKKGKKGSPQSPRGSRRAAEGETWYETQALLEELKETRRARDEWMRMYHDAQAVIDRARSVLDGGDCETGGDHDRRADLPDPRRLDSDALEVRQRIVPRDQDGEGDLRSPGVGAHRGRVRSPERDDHGDDHPRANGDGGPPRVRTVGARGVHPRARAEPAERDDREHAGRAADRVHSQRSLVRRNGDAGDGTAAQRILNAVAALCTVNLDRPTRKQVAVVAGKSISSGSTKAAFGGLIKRGLLTVPEPGRVRFTDAGRKAAEWPETALTGAGILDTVRAMLSDTERAMFDIVWECAGEPVGRAYIADVLGLSPSSGSTKQAFSTLCSTLELCTKPSPGVVALAPWLAEAQERAGGEQ